MTGNENQRPVLAFSRTLTRGSAGLMGAGTLLFLVGTTLGAAALLGAGRRYIRQLDEHPIQLARRGWEQLKGVMFLAPARDLRDLRDTSWRMDPRERIGAHAGSDT